MTAPLRIGLASFAHVHAAGYASRLRSWPDVELLAADPDAASAPPDEQRGIPGVSVLGSYRELFAAGLDGVVVCTENSRHRAVVELAADAGVAVLCEKPIATTVADAEAMISACERRGVTLMIAYPVRFHPAFRSLREQVTAGRLGKVLAASGTNNGQAPIAARRWFVDPELAGGGSLIDHTVHLADLLDDLLGAAPVSVYAQTNQIVHGGQVATETGGLVSVRYADGTLATIDCSWDRPAGYPSWGGLRLALDGSAGSASFDAFGQHVTGYGPDGTRWLGYGSDLDALMLAEFLSAIRERRQPQPDGQVGLRTLRIVTAAYESARTGQPVTI